MALTLYITQASQLSESSELISPVPLESTSESATPTASPQSSPSPIQQEVLSANTENTPPTSSPSPTVTYSPTPKPTNTSTTQPSTSPTPSPSATTTITATNSPQPTTKPTVKPTNSASPTPAATERPKTKEITGPEMDALFTKYSQEYKVDREQLKRIAVCESKLNINALNKAHGYGGLYQFSIATWKSYRKMISQDTNPDLRFDPEEAIETAAWMLSTNRAGAWPNCK